MGLQRLDWYVQTIWNNHIKMQYYKCVNCIQPLNSEVGYCIISILIHSKKMETRKKMGENEYGVDHKPQKDTPLDMSGVGWSWV